MKCDFPRFPSATTHTHAYSILLMFNGNHLYVDNEVREMCKATGGIIYCKLNLWFCSDNIVWALYSTAMPSELWHNFISIFCVFLSKNSHSIWHQIRRFEDIGLMNYYWFRPWQISPITIFKCIHLVVTYFLLLYMCSELANLLSLVPNTFNARMLL